MELTYFGHACFSVRVNGKILLFDPFIQNNPLASKVDTSQVKAEHIFVSHGHSDHLDDCVAIANQTKADVTGGFEVVHWLAEQGVKKIIPMNIGGKKKFEFGTVKCVNAVHSSKLPDGSDGGNPMGFLIMSTEGNFYYSGDTALTMDMQLIPEWASVHFSIFPIGDQFTMDAADAARAADMVRCKTVVGVHYDTFEPIRIDKEEAKKIFLDKGITLLLPEIGETINI
jgi:L-ascorbate metabolism protein UlaG (beta-lactamase superfamily)